MDAPVQKIKERNYGIDFLRIVSMMLIPVLHILGQGGVIDNTPYGSAGYWLEWIMETAAYCSVNCYALISGYVGYGSKHRYSSLLNITLQAIFYLLGVTTLFAVFKPGSVGIKDFIKACIPFGFDAYWYYSAYFCMFFFIPYLNIIIEKTGEKQAKRLVILITVLFSLMPTVFCRDLFGTNEGYCVLWLMLLYLIGAYMKKYDICEKYHGFKCLLGYFICVFFAWGFKFVMHDKSFNLMFISYTSPAILASAVFLFLFFAGLKVKGFWVKFTGFFAPASFGVYLLHVEPLVWNNILYGRFARIGEFSPALTVAAVAGAALGIWLVGSLVDRLRIGIFKLIRIKKLGDRLDGWVDRRFN